MNKESAKSDVNAQKKIKYFCYLVLERDKKTEKMFQKYKDPIYIRSD